MLKNRSRGFTLIELLVVIAIIGILAAVILASLNTARSKGSDAAISSDVDSARAQAELYYSSQSPNSYLSVCTTPQASLGIQDMWHAAAAASGVPPVNGTAGNAICYDGANTWVMEVPLKTTGYFWCADNTGTSSQHAGVTSGLAITHC